MLGVVCFLVRSNGDESWGSTLFVLGLAYAPIIFGVIQAVRS